MLTVILTLSISMSAAPLAEDPVFLEGRSLFDELEFEQAALRFEQVSLDASAFSDEERARALTWLGVCRAKVGNFDAARASFALATRLDREAALPVTVSPAVVAIFDEELQKAKAAQQIADKVKEPVDDKADTKVVPKKVDEKVDPPKVSPEKVDPKKVDGDKEAPIEPELDVVPVALYSAGGLFAAAAIGTAGVGAFLIVDANDLKKTQREAIDIYNGGVLLLYTSAALTAAAVATAGAGYFLSGTE